MKAKLITTNPISWGGRTPEVAQYISVEMEIVSKTENGVAVQFIHNICNKVSITNPDETENSYFQIVQNIERNHTHFFDAVVYNQLCKNATDFLQETNPEITLLEIELQRDQVMLYQYWTTCFTKKGVCYYNTQPNDWRIYQ